MLPWSPGNLCDMFTPCIFVYPMYFRLRTEKLSFSLELLCGAACRNNGSRKLMFLHLRLGSFVKRVIYLVSRKLNFIIFPRLIEVYSLFLECCPAIHEGDSDDGASDGEKDLVSSGCSDYSIVTMSELEEAVRRFLLTSSTHTHIHTYFHRGFILIIFLTINPSPPCQLSLWEETGEPGENLRRVLTKSSHVRSDVPYQDSNS